MLAISNVNWKSFPISFYKTTLYDNDRYKYRKFEYGINFKRKTIGNASIIVKSVKQYHSTMCKLV